MISSSTNNTLNSYLNSEQGITRGNASQAGSIFNLLINPEPITKKELKAHNPQITCIYNGKQGKTLQFIAVAEKVGGSALGSIFKKAQLLGMKNNG